MLKYIDINISIGRNSVIQLYINLPLMLKALEIAMQKKYLYNDYLCIIIQL